MSQTLTESQQQTATTTVEHWIDGASVAGSSERTGPIYNPALDHDGSAGRLLANALVDGLTLSRRA